MNQNPATASEVGQAAERPDRSDSSLLRRFKRGEADAATALYQRYASRLTAFARRQTSARLSSRFDPEDVIQSVFRTFFRRASADSIRAPDGDELWQLLLVIALNKVRRLGRFHRQQLRDAHRTSDGESLGDTATSHDETELLLLQMTIDEALEQFPPLQRRMVEMRIRGETIVEIAQSTSRSRRTVERVLRQFREFISQSLDAPEPDDESLPT